MRSTLSLVGMVASPTFMLISGITVGLLASARPANLGRLARTLAGRGIFLLTLGHLLILIAVIPQAGSLEIAFARGFITDPIGLAALLGPFVARRYGIASRFSISCALMAAAWIIARSWIPTDNAGTVIQYILAGSWTWQNFNFPVLPWLALYFAGTAVGGWIGTLLLQSRFAEIERLLVQIGTGALAAGLLLKLGYWAGGETGIFHPKLDGWLYFTAPAQKLPPSPAYFCFYGGIGLLITAAVFAADRRGIAKVVIDRLSLLGRNSLFVFLLQYYLYYLVLYLLRLPYPELWPIYYIASVLFLFGCARVWDRRGYNRYFNALDWFTRRIGPAVQPSPAVAVARSKTGFPEAGFLATANAQPTSR